MPSTEFTSWIAYYGIVDKAKADAARGDETDDDAGGS